MQINYIPTVDREDNFLLCVKKEVLDAIIDNVTETVVEGADKGKVYGGDV